MKKVMFHFFMALSGGAIALGLYKSFEKKEMSSEIFLKNERSPFQLTGSSSRSSGEIIDFTAAAEATVNAVVHVKTQADMRRPAGSGDPFFDFFFGNPYRNAPGQRSESSGSGVIISDDGYLVTNNHVIANAQKISITLNDKREFEAQVIGKDPTTDLALLKINAKSLPFVPYGNSDAVKVGEWALAVGNPFNLTSTVTAGIISAKGRNINILNDKFAIESFIQTDAAVNPGNSGGALVNTEGKLIGINAAIASNTGSFAGYSFAIPVNIVKKVVADLLEFGEVQRAFIGISLADLNADLAKEKGIKKIEGVYVAGVMQGGAAADAGIQQGDVILRVNDQKVNSMPELQEMIGRFRPGDKVNLTIRRDGNSEKQFTLLLKNKNGDTKLFRVSESILADLGAEFAQVSEEELSKLQISNGVKVRNLKNGKLKAVGIKEGFIITRIGDTPVYTPEDIANQLKSERRGYLIEGIYPNGNRAFYGLGI